MRLPPPKGLRLSRADLMREVGRRLTAADPRFESLINDPADPAWLMLEQAAWMVETMSEQLEQLPRYAIHQLLSLIGHHLLPARPALGVACLEVPQWINLRRTDGADGGARFFSAQTESREAVEFVQLESRLPLLPVRGTGIFRMTTGGELCSRLRAAPDRFPETHELFPNETRPLEVFNQELILFSFARTRLEALRALILRQNQQPSGWMTLGLESPGLGDEVWITWRLGITAGLRGQYQERDERGRQSLVFPWRALTFHGHHLDARDELQFLPQIRLRPNRQQEGIRLEPSESGVLRFSAEPGLEGFSELQLDELLLIARPVPARVAARYEQSLRLSIADWEEQTRQVTQQPGAMRRRLGGEAAMALPWLETVLSDSRWDDAFNGQDLHIFHLEAYGPLQGSSTLRFGVVTRWGGDTSARPARPVIIPYRYIPRSVDRGSLGPSMSWIGENPFSPALPLWQLSWPASPSKPNAARAEPLTLQVFEAAVQEPLAADGFLVVLPDPAQGMAVPFSGSEGRSLPGLLLNPALLANLPIVADGRTFASSSSAVERFSLFTRDVATGEVIRQLEDLPGDQGVWQHIQSLPLASLEYQGDRQQAPAWASLDVDSAEGELTLNRASPDASAFELRRGDSLTLHWYRRTDGERANLGPGSLQVVEQSPFETSRIRAIHNPLPTVHGRNAESPAEGIERMFAPSPRTVPVTASDFEHWASDALGELGVGWQVRAWGEAERTLLSHAWWQPADDARRALSATRQQLASLGGTALLLALGHPDRSPGGPEYAALAFRLARSWGRLAVRLPVLEHLVTTPLYFLQLRPRGTPPLANQFPRYDLRRLQGTLSDGSVNQEVPHSAWYYLNAVVTGIDRGNRNG